MPTDDHLERTRRSFGAQLGLFTGKNAVFGRPAAAEVTLAALQPLRDDMIVLDVACGAGHAAEVAAPYVRQVVAIDVTPALLEAGAARLHTAGVHNVLFAEGDAAALAYVGGSFDLVVCRGAIHHLDDPATAVGEMARVLRPGGRLVVADMVAPSVALRDQFDALHSAMDPSHRSVFVADELLALVSGALGGAPCETSAHVVTHPIDHILTNVADRDAVRGALEVELAGGPATGAGPAHGDEGQVLVSFTTVTVRGIKPEE